MMILQYDGSLCGFLCLLGTAIKNRIEVNQIVRCRQAASGYLFEAVSEIESDREWASKVTGELAKKLGRRHLTNLAYALFSEEEEIEKTLLEVTKRALFEGREVLTQLTDLQVNKFDSATLKTARERHRMLGLLRFSQLADESYLARFKPRTNIVPLIGNHFSKRLGDQRWIIIDENRKLGIWGEKKYWHLIEDVSIGEDLSLHSNEEKTIKLWRNFYRNISNPDRYNPKLRQQFMPKMYWQYLTELHPE